MTGDGWIVALQNESGSAGPSVCTLRASLDRCRLVPRSGQLREQRGDHLEIGTCARIRGADADRMTPAI